jgi:hypothetical protein
VGAVILAPGFAPYDPTPYETYSYAQHPNVVTSLEFERMLSASGPYAGHLIRPSDQAEPSRIAWLQCVGSRDINHCDNGYCSSVCCMYANKQAVIAKEHSAKPLEATIFFMDMRTFGKDFDKYNLRAADEHGVRFVRSRIHSIYPEKDDRLRIVYASESGATVEELFDMVVLSVGLTADPAAVTLAKRLGVDLNVHGFADTQALAAGRPPGPVSSCAAPSRSPRTFPTRSWKPRPRRPAPPNSSAMPAGPRPARWCCRGNRCQRPTAAHRGVCVQLRHQHRRRGRCAGGARLRPHLPHVVHVEDNLFTCSQDSQEHIKAVIREKGSTAWWWPHARRAPTNRSFRRPSARPA